MIERAGNIAILEAGSPPPDMRFPSYSEMIIRALGSDHQYVTYDVRRGELPDDAAARAACGFIITGSSSSAYHDDEWISALSSWITHLPANIPLVGLCFGHQLLAKTLGGSVERSPRGQGAGFHHYEVTDAPPWVEGATGFSIPVVHYDQVVRIPRDSVNFAGNEFCPVGAIRYTGRRAISFQGHPEFSREFASAAIDRLVKRNALDAVAAEAARRSLNGEDDRATVMGWIARFLTSNS